MMFSFIWLGSRITVARGLDPAEFQAWRHANNGAAILHSSTAFNSLLIVAHAAKSLPSLLCRANLQTRGTTAVRTPLCYKATAMPRALTVNLNKLALCLR
jgi:hypothetical protein